jgi:UDP-2-acetamido-3-amino-2,3-dideoxy-glucuronate N-acetyltransferase
MKKYIAVIGCGYWGKNLVRNFSQLGSLFAICDPDARLAQDFSKKYNVAKMSFAEIIKNECIEGVVLAVPAPLHASMAIEAMNFGKNVFVEKPLAMNIEEAEKMKASAKRNNIQLMVGHLLQYHPIFQAILEIVRSQELGSIDYIHSVRHSLGKVRSEEDVVWSFAPHDISMILSIANDEPNYIKDESAEILQEGIKDKSILHLAFPSGLKAHISVSWIHPYKEQKLILNFSSGMIVFDDTKTWSEKLAVYRHKINVSAESVSIEKSEAEFIKIPESEPLKNECLHFLDVVNTNSKPITDAEEGLRVLKVLTAATQGPKKYDR